VDQGINLVNTSIPEEAVLNRVYATKHIARGVVDCWRSVFKKAQQTPRVADDRLSILVMACMQQRVQLPARICLHLSHSFTHGKPVIKQDAKQLKSCPSTAMPFQDARALLLSIKRHLVGITPQI